MRYYIIKITTFDGVVDTLIATTDDGVQLAIPKDPANSDYAAYLEWVAAGNTPEPWQPDSFNDTINNGE